MRADCVTLWIGDSLGVIERACLKSMVRQGHSVALYCYGTPAGVPAGVRVEDASAILPRSSFPPQWSNRSDLYSDWFRYVLQERDLGTWLDLDVYLVAPLELESPYLFGEYEPGKINGAVLRLPPDAPVLDRLLRQFDGKSVPDAMPWRKRISGELRRAIRGNYPLEHAPWGTTGPFALTRYVPQFGLSGYARNSEVFYPAPWQKADWIADPNVDLDQFVTNETIAVHLWNELLKNFKHKPAAAGSFLARLQAEGGD